VTTTRFAERAKPVAFSCWTGNSPTRIAKANLTESDSHLHKIGCQPPLTLPSAAWEHNRRHMHTGHLLAPGYASRSGGATRSARQRAAQPHERGDDRFDIDHSVAEYQGRYSKGLRRILVRRLNAGREALRLT